MTEAIRQIYWNVGEGFAPLALYLAAMIALGVMTWGILRDIARWRRGKPDARIEHLPARLIEALSQVFGQKRVLKDRKPGSMHALIFFGFLALFIGTDIIAVEEDFSIPLIGPAGPVTVPVRSTFLANNAFVLNDALCAGLGIGGAQMPLVKRYHIEEEQVEEEEEEEEDGDDEEGMSESS